MNALTLFAGAGGADIGLRAAGFRHLACVEADAHACATLAAAGFPAVRAWIGDGPQPERQVRGQVQPPLPVFRHDGAPVDLLWASPPCQPYSRAGKQRGADDERDGWPATLAAIREVRPRWVVIENVVGSPAEAWAGELRALYPHVVVWRANAVDWGLPSRRDRLYVIAGPRAWIPPAPTHYGPDVPWLLRGGRRPWNGFGNALGLIGVWGADLMEGKGMVERRGRESRPIPASDKPAPVLRARGHGAPPFRLVPGNGGYARPLPVTPENPAHTITGYCPMYLLQMPAPTVCATEGKGHTNPHLERGRSSPINRASDALYLATGRRSPTPAECAILVGFPDGYPFNGGVTASYRQIGNAVAPIMAEVIGRAILGAA